MGKVVSTLRSCLWKFGPKRSVAPLAMTSGEFQYVSLCSSALAPSFCSCDSLDRFTIVAVPPLTQDGDDDDWKEEEEAEDEAQEGDEGGGGDDDDGDGDDDDDSDDLDNNDDDTR